ncbi:MAG: HAD-IB family phosphatase [Elusimicrobia bacterium]|nr:HAD-IB family phosphatase [Elusimicrobiota bacterium]
MVADFDGTITTRDVGDSILLRFRAATRKEIENSYSFGVSMDKWMREIFLRLRVPRKKIQDHVRASTRLRNGFKEFAVFCAENSVPFEIASGGIDLYAEPVFSKYGLRAKSFFGKARVTGAGVKITYPFLKGKTLDGFKAFRVLRLRRLGCKVIFCGDGTTDLEAARAADKVFAAKKLLGHCRAMGIKAARLKNFHQVREFIRRNRLKA